ncbi:hypothetical protein B6U79_00150 [Candidatus Bathyarchaeota archaeon ex4484_231]|nr:MAG: hypothetical protein B6U79_00150 [Candidatus Bathyarchaeota archaeon ex4484_231]RJS74928.1 MAG: hypothetical protein CW712_05765 [Candidatus Bathyarchaeota archaeon]
MFFVVFTAHCLSFSEKFFLYKCSFDFFRFVYKEKKDSNEKFSGNEKGKTARALPNLRRNCAVAPL